MDKFLELSYNFCYVIHIFTAFLVTFIVIPINLFTRKGSNFHKRMGRICVILVLCLTSSSFFMLINPKFTSLFALTVNEHYMWKSFFKSSFYEPVFFFWLDMIAIYLMISAVRIWPRVAAIKNGEKHYNSLDIMLSVIMAISALFFMYVGIYDIKNHHPFAMIFISIGVKMIIMVILDIWTFIKSNQWLIKWGWVVHGYKIFILWHGLIYAYLVRINISLKVLEHFSIFITEIFLGITLVVFSLYMVNLHKKSISLGRNYKD